MDPLCRVACTRLAGRSICRSDNRVGLLPVSSCRSEATSQPYADTVSRLMGQDGIYLQVVSRDKGEPQHNNARRVYDLLQKGKHWVLVTLLLGNVIVNETLPVVLDRCLGGGVAAVVGSTVLIGTCQSSHKDVYTRRVKRLFLRRIPF
jgi:hypothetical protein